MRNDHLDAEALDRHIAGERSAAAERHLAECPACRRKAERLDLVLAEFRRSAQRWSESRPPLDWTPLHRLAPRWLKQARWVAVATAAVMLAAVPLYRNYAERRAEAQAKADAVLLEEISADVSRPAPEPLEPLIKLVSQ